MRVRSRSCRILEIHYLLNTSLYPNLSCGESTGCQRGTGICVTMMSGVRGRGGWTQSGSPARAPSGQGWTLSGRVAGSPDPRRLGRHHNREQTFCQSTALYVPYSWVQLLLFVDRLAGAYTWSGARVANWLGPATAGLAPCEGMRARQCHAPPYTHARADRLAAWVAEADCHPAG